MTRAEMVALHQRSFTAAARWSAESFDEILSARGVMLLAHRHGFLVGRVVADEAELLTIAVAPKARGHGIGRRLCTGFAAEARKAGAKVAFLEVAVQNRAARALYAGCGWVAVGRRPDLYGRDVHGVTMRLDLTAAPQPPADSD